MEFSINIRKAIPNDAKAIWDLIRELAIYERAESEHTLTETQLKADLNNNLFTCFLAEVEDEIVGMALLFPVYSTWKGASLNLEDIVVRENHRRKGIGSKLFFEVVRYAKSQKANRLSWQVLNWNQPAIEFYKKHNAILDEEWINCKFTSEALQQFDFQQE